MRQRATRGTVELLPDPSELTSLKQVREALAHVDVTFPHSVKDRKGEWSSFDIDTLKAMYASRRKHMLEEPKIKLWWDDIHPSTDARACVKHAIFFWFNLDDSPSLQYAIAQGHGVLDRLTRGLIRLTYVCICRLLVDSEPNSSDMGHM